jgi:transcriptional regulator of acetoin/glycerol metabolism
MEKGEVLPTVVAGVLNKQLASGRDLQDVEDDYIRTAMQTHQGNVSAVARQLGMSRNTLYRKLKNLGIA